MSGQPASAPVELAREQPFAFDGVRVTPATLEVLGDLGREVLEPRVMQVLVALARAAGEVVSRDALIQACWGGRVVSDDAINRCIGRLRRIADKFKGFAIETVPRVGYRLRGSRMDGAVVTALSGKPSIALLPFANLSGDPEQDFFADGMVEEIATALTRFRSLFVIAGASGLSLKGQGLTPQEAGRRLGVRYLLDGAVRRSADRIRISVTLIDARDGVQLWAERFDGAISDIFSLQDDVALSAAAKIEPQVQAEEARRAQAKPAASLDAYDLFLRAKVLANAASREGRQEALPLYERCLELDPSNARALVSSALSLAALLVFSPDGDSLRPLIRQRVHRALHLAPDDAEVLALAALALHDLREDITAARALAARAVALNPSNAHGWRASGWLSLGADPNSAAERLEESLKLDPLSPDRATTLTGLGVARLAQQRIEDAIVLFSQSAQLLSGYPLNYLLLSASHAQLGRLGEARENAAKFQANSGRKMQEIAEQYGASDWIKSGLARVPDI